MKEKKNRDKRGGERWKKEIDGDRGGGGGGGRRKERERKREGELRGLAYVCMYMKLMFMFLCKH